MGKKKEDTKKAYTLTGLLGQAGITKITWSQEEHKRAKKDLKGKYIIDEWKNN